MDYKTLYDNMICQKTKIVIVKYQASKNNFEYIPFSHHSNKNWLDDMYDLLIDNIVFYAFSEDEILERNKKIGLLNDLKIAAKYACENRLPKRKNPNTDGIVGELLLDLLIQVYEVTCSKMLARTKYNQMGDNSEIKGYDLLYFVKDEKGKISMWLGQAKAGAYKYCKEGIRDDLNQKYINKYFADSMFYVADKSDNLDLSYLLDGINNILFEAIDYKYKVDEKEKKLFEYLKKENVSIKIPCLLAYTNDIYKCESELQMNINECIDSIKKYFDTKVFNIEIDIDYEIIFYVFPIKSVPELREKIMYFKR
ncbi:DUF1837 domain-containing protein [Mobilitalea sibirica]|uniref:DUF1837 domain-containing protein n=1 Tax=Mobilitalea sibirica TaxID=1462919 RepID=A0A8J7KW85_9FIRM|nr:Hachiman antiphage defense system protein HamA [Mobilitalea sibirica]MBH1940092.1 DUF1837 domain-containing protein [Mobilitalea sibirica]